MKLWKPDLLIILTHVVYDYINYLNIDGRVNLDGYISTADYT